MGKKILILILITISFQICYSQNQERPKVAVVLSGGGAKGFAHIGVLKVLEDEGIPVDIIVGTSMGGLVGGLYSIGYNADTIRYIAHSADWALLLSDKIPRKELDQYSREVKQRFVLSIPITKGEKLDMPKGLIKGQNIINLFCGLTANVPKDANFKEFPIPFSCVGTDLVTGEEIILDSGFLPTALFSTMAIPGVFVPGEYNGHVLVDGGMVNNFPVDVAKKMGADIIIGVDISTGMLKGNEIVSIGKVMDQLINFFVLRKNTENRAMCDIIIRPDIEGYTTSSFNTTAVDTLFNRGMAAAKAVVNELKDIKAKYNLQPHPISKALIKENQWEISDISFSGNYSMSDKFLMDGLELNIPQTYSFNAIKKSINNLYGTDNFKRAYFNLEDNFSGKHLNILLDEERRWSVNIGTRLNSRSALSLVLNSTRKDYTKTIGLLSFTADISSNPRVNLLFEVDKKDLPKLSLMIDGMYKNLSVNYNKETAYSTDLIFASAKLYSSQRISKNAMIGSGIKQDYYNGTLNSIAGDSLLTTPHEKYITHLVGYINYDNLDDYYFPSKGTEIFAEISLAQDKGFHYLNPIALFKMRNVIPLDENFCLLLNFSGRSLMSETTSGHLRNFVGGSNYEILFNHHLPFIGLPTFWPTERNTFTGLTGLLLKIDKKNFLSMSCNYLMHNDEFIGFNDYEKVWSGGLTYAYRSAIGPMEVTVGYSGKYRKPTISANVGFWF